MLSNHYHLVAQTGEAQGLRRMASRVHTLSARELNRADGTPGRKVWHNYWDTHLTIETSYLARLKYVQENPVHHGLCPVADQYQWCSARWFQAQAGTAFLKTVMSFKTDKLKVADEY